MSASLDDSLMVTLAGSSQAARERAFKELTRRHADGLTRFARCLERDPQVVEDVVQDTFLRLYQARDRYEPGKAPFRAWLTRIARNLILDIQRKRIRQDTHALGERQVRAASDMGPVRQVLDQARAQEIRAAVDQLPPLDREALLLRFDEQLAHKDIAELMDTTTQAVKQRLYRARRALRDLLGEA